MKPIIFSENELNDIAAIGQKLFADQDDPRSNEYIRKLIRPRINWFKIVLYISLPIIFIWLSFHIAERLLIPSWYLKLSVPICAVLYFWLTKKKAAICLIRIYQRYASSHLRNKCRFEPSCSEYMILAIQKYGFFAGIRKGINRLKRCNIDDGGYDYP